MTGTTIWKPTKFAIPYPIHRLNQWPPSRVRRASILLSKPIVRSGIVPHAGANGRVLSFEKEAKLEVLKKQVQSLKEALAIIEVAITDAESCMEGLKSEEVTPSVEIRPVKHDLVCGKVVVCIGKDCKKQGSLEAFKRLGQELSDRPELERVKLQTSKCLKECGKGPVVATKFGKKKMKVHKKVKPKQIGQLLSKDLEGV